jgi:hypothetical protein
MKIVSRKLIYTSVDVGWRGGAAKIDALFRGDIVTSVLGAVESANAACIIRIASLRSPISR